MATTHNLKVRAELDASQARQQIESLKNALGGFGNNGTLDFSGVEKALSNLASSLTGFKAQMDKAAQEMSKIQYKGGAGGGVPAGNPGGSGGGGFFSFRGGSMRGMHRGAYGALAYGGAGVLGGLGGYFGAEADMLEASGADFETVYSKRSLSEGLTDIGTGAKTVGSFAMTGALLGGGVGAGIGAAVGTAVAALEYFSNKLSETADALASTKERLGNIAASHKERQEDREYEDLSGYSKEELLAKQKDLQARRQVEMDKQNRLGLEAKVKKATMDLLSKDLSKSFTARGLLKKREAESKKLDEQYGKAVTEENRLKTNESLVQTQLKRIERAEKLEAEQAEHNAKYKAKQAQLEQQRQKRLARWSDNMLADMDDEEDLEKLKIDAQKMSVQQLDAEIAKRKSDIETGRKDIRHQISSGPMTEESQDIIKDINAQIEASKKQLAVLEHSRKNIELEDKSREKAIKQLAEMQVKGESILTKIGKMGGYMSKMEMQSMTNANNNPVVSKMRDMENVLKQIEKNTVGVGTLG